MTSQIEYLVCCGSIKQTNTKALCGCAPEHHAILAFKHHAIHVHTNKVFTVGSEHHDANVEGCACIWVALQSFRLDSGAQLVCRAQVAKLLVCMLKTRVVYRGSAMA